MENNYLQSDLFKGTQKMLAFDIEISKELPDDFGDFKANRPLGISCAAALTDEGDFSVWHGGKKDGEFTEQMKEAEVLGMINYLWDMFQAGYQIYTWNGLGFDFDILFEESGGDERCKQMACSHVDMMFHFFCIKGYAISLDKAARGMGLEGKTEGMDGALAPKMWRQEKFTQVLDYLAQDVCITLGLAQQCDRKRKVRWTSNRGREQECSLPEGWLPVDQALKLPEPDTSWMSTPWPRSKFTGWL
jgi:hypothetical protein